MRVNVTIASDADRDRAADLIDRLGAELQGDPAWSTRLLDPPNLVRVEPLEDGSIMLAVVAQIRASDDEAVGAQLRRRIVDAFSQADIALRVNAADEVGSSKR